MRPGLRQAIVAVPELAPAAPAVALLEAEPANGLIETIDRIINRMKCWPGCDRPRVLSQPGLST
jgi:hypothetical protein